MIANSLTNTQYNVTTMASMTKKQKSIEMILI